MEMTAVSLYILFQVIVFHFVAVLNGVYSGADFQSPIYRMFYVINLFFAFLDTWA